MCCWTENLQFTHTKKKANLNPHLILFSVVSAQCSLAMHKTKGERFNIETLERKIGKRWTEGKKRKRECCETESVPNILCDFFLLLLVKFAPLTCSNVYNNELRKLIKCKNCVA